MNFNERLAEIKIRLGLGMSWFNELKNALLMGASLKIILNLNVLLSALFVIFIFIGFYLIGCLDMDILKIFQKIQELNTFKYNVFKKSLRRHSVYRK